MMENKAIRIGLAILAFVVVIGGAYGIIRKGEKSSPPTAGTGAENQAEEASAWLDERIVIPGTDVLELKAGERKQIVNFYNPENNKCYLKVCLLKEDGKVLYQSELIAPGETVNEIELKNTLSKGTYENAMLKYECFAMDEGKTPLNGAELALTIQSN